MRPGRLLDRGRGAGAARGGRGAHALVRRHRAGLRGHAAGPPLRLLHIDSDLYESARTVLAHLRPWIVPGTVLVLDEYLGHTTWRDDEYRAFIEAAQAYGWSYEYLALCWVTGQASVRLVAT